MRYGPIIILPLAAILLTSGLRQGIKQQPESLPLTDFKFEVEEVHTPGIVKLDANRISGHVEALDSFFLKLTALEQKESDLPVTIFQLGDSHVQAGTYPNQVRTRLQRLFGNAGRGLIVPLRLSGTNQSADYTISSPNHWEASRCTQLHPEEEPGLSGIALIGSDNTISFTITDKESSFDRIRAFHDSLAPRLQAPAELTDDIECPLGDTPESTYIPLNQSVNSVTLRGPITDPHYNHQVYYGFSLENGQPGILYHSMGINGNTFTAVNRNPQIIRQATALFPDLIVISLGTNDSYGRNFNADYVGAQIDKLVGLIRQNFPNQPLLLTTPIECSQTARVRGRSVRKPNPNSRKVRDQILRIAAKYQLPVWDFFTVAGSEGAIARWYEAGLANSDRIHLTHEGYRLQGELLCDALIRAYNDYKGFSGSSAIAPKARLINKQPQIPLDKVISSPQKRQEQR